jgi:hypothetical protein
MPTSALYDSTRRTLASRLPGAKASQLDTLALVLVGVTQSVSAQLAAIARAMPLDTRQVLKEQRLRRFLDNDRITQGVHYQPLVQAALMGLKGQAVHLLIDRVLLRDTHNVLVVSIGFRRRSLPLAWSVLPHRGKSNRTDQQGLLSQALALLPAGVRVTVHGDSEFRGWELFSWLRERGCDVFLGLQGNTYIRSSPDGERCLLQEWLTDRATVVYLSEMYLTEAAYGPVSVLAWWGKDEDGKPIVRAVMTNLPASWQSYRKGGRRMWIETVFRDWQSGGFHLDRSGISEPGRLLNLLLPLAIAYLWLVSLGRWVVKKGYRELIDDGTSDNWHYSLFQLGVGWKERLASYTKAIPVLLYLYL